jgi:hypothetical protein
MSLGHWFDRHSLAMSAPGTKPTMNPYVFGKRVATKQAWRGGARSCGAFDDAAARISALAGARGMSLS